MNTSNEVRSGVPARQFSPAMQISSYYIILFFRKFIVFTVNEHENISIAGLNPRAGFATGGKHYIGINREA